MMRDQDRRHQSIASCAPGPTLRPAKMLKTRTYSFMALLDMVLHYPLTWLLIGFFLYPLIRALVSCEACRTWLSHF